MRTAPFMLIPSVDVSGGKAQLPPEPGLGSGVRRADPIAVASAWIGQGASWLQLRDLDAVDGTGTNHAAISRAVRHLRGKAAVQVCGGIVDDASLEAALATGCDLAVLDSAVLANPVWLEGVVRNHGRGVSVQVDVHGTGFTAHLETPPNIGIWETIASLDAAGCSHYQVTNTARHGRWKHSAQELLRQVCRSAHRPVVAAGGIGRLEDLHELSELTPEGLAGAVLDEGLYSGAYSFAEAQSAIAARFDPYEWGPARP